MRKALTTALTMVLLLGAATLPASAWGCAGHEVIALLAARHLQPAVLARVRVLLAIPVGPQPSWTCPASAALPPMAQAASWADETRTAATAPFHFVDLPLAARRGAVNYNAICQGDCLSAALDRFVAELRRPATPAAERARALRYVIHLVGDAFQPLHVSDDGDRGGNCVRTRLPGQRHAANLHADWDSDIVRLMMAGASPAAYARRLDRRFGRRYAAGSLQPLDWIWSSHAVARRTAFGPLHLAPGCPRRLLRLSSAYLRGAQGAIAVQLDRAGWRLATLLNQVLA